MAEKQPQKQPDSTSIPNGSVGASISAGFAPTETHSLPVSNAEPSYHVELYCVPGAQHSDIQNFPHSRVASANNRSAPVFDPEAVFEDVKHQKNSTAAEECFSIFCDNVVDSAIVLLDKKGCVVSWNKGAQRLFGYKETEVLGENYSRFFASEDNNQRNPEKALRVTSHRGSLELQGWHLHSDGQKFWAKSLLLARRCENHTLQGFAVITQSLHFVHSPADAAFKETSKVRSASFVFDSVLQQIHDPVFVKDSRGRYIMANEAAARTLGYEPHEIIGKKDSELLPDSVRKALVENDQQVIESGQPTEFEETVVKGPVSRVFLTYKAPLRNASNRAIGIIGIARDITQRHYAEKQLRENEERFSWLTRHASDMIARHDCDGYFNDVSAACEAVTGYQVGKLLGRSFTDFVHEDDAAKILQTLRDCATNSHPLSVVYRWRNPDGSERWLESTFSSANRDNTGQHNTEKASPHSDATNLNNADLNNADLNNSEAAEISSVTRDVTWRRHIEQEREELLQREQAALCEAGAVIQRLQEIQQITDAALTHLRPENIISELLSRICQLLDAGEANVWLLEENQKFLSLHISFPFRRESALRSRLALGHGVAGKVAQRKTSLLVPDVAIFETGNLFQSTNGHSVMALPLLVEDHLVGVIEVRSQRVNQFTEQHLHLLQLVADRCATTIERARLFEQVKNGQEQMQTLSRRLLTVQEEERRHIARELHDDIGQYLTLVKLQLQSALRASTQQQENTPQNSENTHTIMLSESVETVEKAIGQVRQLARNLRPSVLDDLGLATALQSHYERHAVPAGLKFQVSVELPQERLNGELEIACFRVAQEALTNIIRHARASTVRLILRQQRSNLHLIVEDDGIGFDVADHRNSEARQCGIGLLNIEERIHLVNGRLQIHSRVGRGTKLHAIFPLVDKDKQRKNYARNQQRDAGQMTWIAGQS